MTENSPDLPARVYKYGVPVYLSVMCVLIGAMCLASCIEDAAAFATTSGTTTIGFAGHYWSVTRPQAIAYDCVVAAGGAFMIIASILQLVLRPKLMLYKYYLSIPKHPFTAKHVIVPYAEITRVTTESMQIQSRYVFLKIDHQRGTTRIFAKQLPRKGKDLANVKAWLRQKCRPGVVEESHDQLGESAK